MTYQELLERPEWQDKRLEILKRDKFKCQNCDNSEPTKELYLGLYEPQYCTPQAHYIVINSITENITTDRALVELKMEPYLKKPA